MGIRIAFIVTGVVLDIFTFWAHCTKKLTVDYAVKWSLLGVVLILVGIFPIFSEWANCLGAAEWILFSIGGLFLSVEVHESMVISQMTMRGKELAMQVALLSQENEAMRAEIERLLEVQGESDAEKDLICH